MSHHKQPPTIEESLRRMFAALDRADSTLNAFFHSPVHPSHFQRQANPWRSVADHVAWGLQAQLERRRLKHQRRMERERLREERRRRRLAAQQAGNPVMGVVMMVAAGFAAYLAFQGQPFWLYFVALGLFFGGAAQFGRRAPSGEESRANEPRKLDVPAPTAAEADEAKRVDELARQLTKELQEGPAVLRQIVEKPAQTIDGLRKGYHAIAERERKLRALLSPEEDARLERDRASLVERRDRATDDVTRARYDDALRALDQQRKEREGLRTTANRLEAERVRLRFTLESLLSQVVRARSMHGLDASSGSDAALRQSLQQLTEEIGAVAEAVSEISEPATRSAERVR
ncbi:MAG: hypothetical protein IRZ16_01090 [Myxococcaceae bacterium]|nr:hypothetical protein [Myxococcaceae bacterium]